ncbi:hypothetical protein [Paenibacillus campinasensis]|uniref:Uncharacterized protein n=1 Tax=Paenibacillus campinasensis TaxID=66347 RepID=A0A268EIX7_9BACL|nr:hypothetical protein [Paenibacillus campinasensis]PAD73080.1 hypothetical protein CHH67_21005 [Paenibacillus campinasensis]
MSRKKSFRRAVSTMLAVALLIPTVLWPGKNTVEGAGYGNIVSVDYYTDHQLNTANVPRPILNLSDGRKVFMHALHPSLQSVGNYNYQLLDLGTDHLKYLHFGSGDDGYAMKLTTSGDFYVRKDRYSDATRTFEKWADGWTDFVYVSINSNNFSFYGLKVDGSVVAVGQGTSGQLGTGLRQNLNVPFPVQNPDQPGTPLTGVRKMIQLDRENVLFITDDAVYKIGRAFGSNSFSNDAPINVTSLFPSFHGADFEMGYINPGLVGDIRSTNPSSIAMRYFKIDGNYYTLTDTTIGSKYISDYNGYNELNSTTLYPIDDPTNTVRAFYRQDHPVSKAIIEAAENTFFEINPNGDLVTWGLPINQIGARTVDTRTYNSNKQTILTDVKKVAVNTEQSISLVAALGNDGNVYVLGNNSNSTDFMNNVGLTGIQGRITTPTRVLGPDLAIQNITDIAFSSDALFLLKDTGDIYVFYKPGAVYSYNKSSGIKFVGLLEIQQTTDYRVVYGIDEVGNLHRMTGEGRSTPLLGASGIYPPGYSPVSNTIEKPLESISHDKFENTIVTLDYPAAATIKEYSLDNGATWLNYNGPIVINTVGSVTVQARSGLDTGSNIIYSDPLIFSINNDPIEIPIGYPKLLEQDGVVTIDTGAIDLNRVNVQISVNGQVSDYHAPIQLPDGNHSVSAIILNKANLELAKVTQNITVAPAAPGVPTAPVGHIGNVDANNQRPLTFTFNPTQGSLQIQHDNGPWLDEPEILNQYSGVSSDPSPTERKYELVVPNVVGSVYKARVTNGVNFSSETMLVVSGQVYDPSFSRDSSDRLLIDFSNLPTGNWSKEYSIDNGATYLPYNGAIDIGPYLPIRVKVTDLSSGQVLIDKEYITPALNGNNPAPNPGVDPAWGREISGADQEAIINVIGGGLSSKFNGLMLDNIEIQTTNQYQTINSVTNTLIEDSTGSGGGWSYSLSVTDFVSDPVLDTGLGTQDLVVKIPASSLSVNVQPSKVLAGSPDSVAKVGSYVLSEQKQTLAEAEAFKGMGYYDIPMDYMFRVPSTVEVVSAGNGSAHQVGDKVGLRVGVYRSLFTFTLSKGI